jgi:hypothetical protein
MNGETYATSATSFALFIQTSPELLKSIKYDRNEASEKMSRSRRTTSLVHIWMD